jgi:hypothetical protein
MQKFELGEEVTITASGESGLVIGSAFYLHAEPSFLIRYKCADGRAVESWWTEQALEKSA